MTKDLTNEVDAIIFDIDGVLINSVEISYLSKVAVLEEYGIDLRSIPDPHGESHKAASAKTLLQSVEAHTQHKIDLEEFIQRAGKQIYNDLKKNISSADKDLIEFLDNLKSYGVPLAVVTSNTEKSANNKLGLLGINDYFKIVINADDVKNHKPHPAPYLTAMRRLNARPSHCIIFEDSLAGVQSGVSAGGVVVGVTKYNSIKKPLTGAIRTIDSWDEVGYDQLCSLVKEPLQSS